MRDHGGGCRVLDLGVGDDAHGHAVPPLDQARDGLDPRIVKRALGAIGVDAHGVGRGLVARGVGAGRIRRVGDDRIAARGRDQCHVRHVVDGEPAFCLALGDAFGEVTRRDPVRERQAVADEQDHVLGPAWPGVIDGPRHLAAVGSIRRPHKIRAGLLQCDVAQDDRRLVLAVLALDELHRFAEHGNIIGAVDRYLDPVRCELAGELNLEVECCAAQDFGTVERVDGLGIGGGGREQDCGGGGQQAHGIYPQGVTPRGLGRICDSSIVLAKPCAVIPAWIRCAG